MCISYYNKLLLFGNTFHLKTTHLSWVFPSSIGGKGRGGSVDVLWSGVWRTGLRAGTNPGDLAWDMWCVAGWLAASGWGGGGGGGGTCETGDGGTGGEGSGGGAGELVGEEGKGAVTWSSLLGVSEAICAVAWAWVSTFTTESLSTCGGSVLVGREDVELASFGVDGRGEEVPLALARAAASAARRSFFLRVSSAPKLELRGKRDAGGERLAGRLLWELLPPKAEDGCLLLRERDEERREE